MNIGEQLRTLLLADDTVSAAMGTRIYPVKFPQAPTYPAATYQQTGGGPLYTKDGPDTLAKVSMQIDVYAALYDAMVTCSEAIVAVLSGYAGSPFEGIFLEDTKDLPVSGLERTGPSLFRRTLEFTIWYQET